MIFLTAEGLALRRHLLAAQHPAVEVPVESCRETVTKQLKMETNGVHTILVTSPLLGLLNEHSRLFVTQPPASEKLPNEFDAFLYGMAKHRGFSKFKEKREMANGVKQLRWQLFLSLKRKCVQLFMFSLN